MNKNKTYDHSEVQLNWKGNVPSLEIIAFVRECISNDLKMLPRPSDLYYHVIPLAHTYDGPCVVLYGQNDDTFKAIFYDVLHWVKASEIKEE